MLTLKRFRTLIDSYGAAPERWPDSMRAEAEVLLRVSPEAQQLLAEARELDEAIGAASEREKAVSWPPGEEAAALARLRSGVAARLARTAGQAAATGGAEMRGTALAGAATRRAEARGATSGRGVEAGSAAPGSTRPRSAPGDHGARAPSRWHRALRRWMLPVAQWPTSARLAGMAAAGGFIIAVGLFLGSMDATRPAPQVDVLAMLQPDPLPFLADQ